MTSGIAVRRFAVMNDELKRQLFSKILVGYDARPESRDAVGLGCELAELTQARLLVASVFPYHRQPIGEEAFEQALREDGERLFSPLLDELDGNEIETFALGDQSPAEALNQLAEQEQADLTVLGSTHRGRLGRVLLGSTAQRLLTDAECPVAIAPRGFTNAFNNGGFRVIAVAFDGSRESRAALRLAAELAQHESSSLRVIAVNAPIRTYGYLPAEPSLREVVQGSLDKAIADLPSEVRPLGQMLDGDPAKVLVEQVELGVDLLVMGSHGRGALGRAALGSVASRGGGCSGLSSLDRAARCCRRRRTRK